jgi:hypothetical protein
LTLTAKPVKEQSVKYVRFLGQCLVNLLHLKRYRKKWWSMLAVMECKKTKDGLFYYHIHCLVDGYYIPQELISEDWKKISGFPVVWIEKAGSIYGSLRYVLKYVLKGFAFEDKRDVRDFRKSMKGVRYVRSYGGFYGYDYRSAKHVYFACPGCEAVKSWIVLEYCRNVDLVEGVGYDPP